MSKNECKSGTKVQTYFKVAVQDLSYHALNYTGDLFIVVKDHTEPARLFGWADNRRIVQHWTTDFQNNIP